MALQAQEDKRRTERENFLITTIPITVQAAYEPSLYHAIGDDHDEGISLTQLTNHDRIDAECYGVVVGTPAQYWGGGS
jgi:hypothetical protein